MPTKLEEEFTRTHALARTLKILVNAAADLDDCTETIGAAVFLASELEEQLEKLENLAADWKIKGGNNDD
jgi:hypothetical protein